MAEFITKWTDELRYAHYSTWSPSYIESLKATLEQSTWRPHYHIHPQTGLLNDPNGFSFFNDEWHLFYQAFPFGSIHGLKSWAHLTSKDLIDWNYEGLALKPDTDFDSHGVYSGSALPIGDKLFMFYTGNVRDKQWRRKSYQNGAWLDINGVITKEATPILSIDSKYTSHFRDPMIFPYQDGLVMIIGAQDLAEKGKIVTYFSPDKNVHHFEKIGDLHFTDLDLGYMVECPNLVFINDQPILLFCPQGLDPNISSYQNIYPNMYVIADSFNLKENELINPTSFKNLDDGFDVYATQAFNAPDGRALAVSWIGLPDITYPSDSEGWAHCLSLVKELTLKNGKLYQYPVKETLRLRKDAHTLTNGKQKLDSHSFELTFTVPLGKKASVTLFADDNNSNGLELTIDGNNGKMTLDRTNAGLPFAEAYGTNRTVTISTMSFITVNIFVDHSVVEIYLNSGEKTLTSRVFPKKEQDYLVLKNVTNPKLYSLKKSIS